MPNILHRHLVWTASNFFCLCFCYSTRKNGSEIRTRTRTGPGPANTRIHKENPRDVGRVQGLREGASSAPRRNFPREIPYASGRNARAHRRVFIQCCGSKQLSKHSPQVSVRLKTWYVYTLTPHHIYLGRLHRDVLWPRLLAASSLKTLAITTRIHRRVTRHSRTQNSRRVDGHHRHGPPGAHIITERGSRPRGSP